MLKSTLGYENEERGCDIMVEGNLHFSSEKSFESSFNL